MPRLPLTPATPQHGVVRREIPASSIPSHHGRRCATIFLPGGRGRAPLRPAAHNRPLQQRLAASTIVSNITVAGMRVVCPACEAIYEVPESRLVGGRQRMRCARCQHEWDFEPPSAEPANVVPQEAKPPMDVPAVEPVVAPAAPAPSDSPAPEASTSEEKTPPTLVAEPRRARPDADTAEPPRLKRSVLLAWVLSVLVILGVAGAAVQYRDPLMRAWPPSERVFVWLGYAPSSH